MVIRTLKDDEGCDLECPYCGHPLRIGCCNGCGWKGTECANCEKFATKIVVDEYYKGGGVIKNFVFLCGDCCDEAFRQQNEWYQ